MAVVFIVTGCGVGPPRPRIGTLPTPPPGPRFEDPNNLGKHSYRFNPFEKNCIVYTCKAGHIDITHVRWNADHTRYLAKKIRKALMKKSRGFSFNVSLEASKHTVEFTYPENWDDLSRKEKEEIANKISLQVGPYLAFNATLWHEVLTWFGVRFAGLEPDFNSSFSWEDVYSNLLGTQIGAEAIKDPALDYNTAVTRILNRELKELGVQSRSTAIRASKKMKGKWFSGIILVDVTRKNLDIGLDDGFVTPVLVPGICRNAQPQLRRVPTTDILAEYGFAMKHEIRPKEWAKDKILKIVHGDKKNKTIQPAKHYPLIMAHITREALLKYGYIID